ELLINNNKGFEYEVKKEYANSKDPIKALRKVPIRIRRLFIDAYKAYIFNKTLSNIIKNGDDLKARPNDVCFILDGRNRLGMFDGKYQSILAIPTIGYGYKSNHRFAEIIDAIMREEGINHKDFYIKEMQEISSSSGFRQALLYCNEFNYTLEPLTISFTLQVGGYATILLRELMKSKDPLASGF
ncbi:MAG: tRNA pseudouridine(13) synthase TruD, partial [Candidatus Nitrosothermus koennekii]